MPLATNIYEEGSLLHLARQGHPEIHPSVALDLDESSRRTPNRSLSKHAPPRRHRRAMAKAAASLTTYGEGLDFSGTANFGCMRSTGRNFCCMYMKWVGRGGFEAARAAGLRPIVIYETSGVDYRGGYGAGVAAARAAQAWCNANGYPNAVVYMTYDTDVLGVGQYGLAAEYARGWRDTLGLGRVGGYGQNGLVTALYSAGLIGYVWVTYAWSGGNLGAPGVPIHCYQNPNDINVCGTNCDRDRSFTPTMGAIGEGSGPAPGPPPKPVEEDDVMGSKSFVVPPGGVGGQPVWCAPPKQGGPYHWWYGFGVDNVPDPKYVQMARLAIGGRNKGFRPPLAPAAGWGPYDVPLGASYIGWMAQDDDDGISVLPYAFNGYPNVPVTVTLDWVKA